MFKKGKLDKQTERIQTFANVDPLIFLMENTPFLADEARRVKNDLAVNHRGVKVGTVAIVSDVEKEEGDCFLGQNYTPYEGADKYCAEMKAFGRAKRHGRLHRDAAIVAGPSNRSVIKSVTGFEAATLPPCPPCSEKFLQNSTVILSTSAEEDESRNVYQLYTGAQLKDIYATERALTNRQRDRRKVEEPTPVIYDPTFLAITGAVSAYEEMAFALEFAAYETEQELRMAQAEAAVLAIYDEAARLDLLRA